MSSSLQRPFTKEEREQAERFVNLDRGLKSKIRIKERYMQSYVHMLTHELDAYKQREYVLKIHLLRRQIAFLRSLAL